MSLCTDPLLLLLSFLYSVTTKDLLMSSGNDNGKETGVHDSNWVLRTFFGLPLVINIV